MVFGLCPSHSTFNITCGADKSGRASKLVFFIAQNELSVKINITNIIPFQTKSCKFDFCKNEIISWNIGYLNDNEKYFISILKDNTIFFTAERNNEKKVMKL